MKQQNEWHYYNDSDRHACQWARNLIEANLVPKGRVDERSIHDVKPDDVRGFTQCHFFSGILGWPLALQLAGWDESRPVWTASCPCQPYSAAGRGEGDADPRNLWPHLFRLVRECRPDTIFGEQVESAIRHGWLDGISADLEREGYAVGAVVLGAHSVGGPHIRQRLFWVAHTRQQSSRDAQAGIGSGKNCEPPRRGAEAIGEPGRRGVDLGMAHAVSQWVRGEGRRDDGAETSRVQGPDWQRQRFRPDAGASRRLPDHWSNFDIIPCLDGKARRVESGLEPLVDGVPFRLADGRTVQGASRPGLLKGSGNAIVPPLAAEFIAAFLATEATR